MGAFWSATRPDDKRETGLRAAVLRPLVARWLPRVVLVATALVAAAAVRSWLTASTHHLYLDDRADVRSSSDARQRFVVEGARVVPQILTHDEDGFRFRVPASRDGVLRFRARPEGSATLAVRWLDASGASKTLGRQTVTGPVDVAYRLPAPGGLLDLASEGAVVWSDLRIEETFPWWPHASMLGLLVLVGWLLPRSNAAFAIDWSPRERFLLVRTGAAAVASLLALAALEVGLRAAAWASPAVMAVERSRLGEVAPDPHWQDSPRYGRVPRPHRDGVGEWTLGDIVRMGFVPPEMSPALLHRFPVRTDAEGFRNDSDASAVDVAALGDSFTDALTLPLELGWPARLQARLGRPVRNYGVAGFGPQQELRVLRDFVLPRGPRLVVVAFFAGNDIPGASLFDEFERTGETASFGVAGWPFKREVARLDRSYAFLFARRLLVRDVRAAESDASAPGRRFDAAFSGEDPSAGDVTRASFDRGMFSVPVEGRTMRFALMPPYLNLLNLDRAQIEAQPGWRLTRESLVEMDESCRAGRARLVVMFIPSKSQVYLPLLERSFTTAELREALRFFLPNDPWGLDLQRMARNRLAQNELLAAFCRKQGIAFVDLTPELARVASSGRNVYFPDDSHWNARGHQVAADRLAAFLADEPIPNLHAGRP